MKKIECVNCETDDKNEVYYKYEKKIYCISCLEDYFNDEIAYQYFDMFLDEDCEEIK